MLTSLRVRIVFIGLLLASCAAPAQGPTAWLDRPLNNTQVPEGSIIIQAHASDVEGVDSISFYVDEELLSSVSTGGDRLGEAAVEWSPPGPGTYIVQAEAMDINGNTGNRASSAIQVGGELLPATATESASTEAAAPSETPTASATPTALPPTATLQAPTNTLQATSTQAPEPTLDSTPPEITYVHADPGSILTEGNGCSGYARTTTITTIVTDAGGLNKVVAKWNIGGESGRVSLSLTGQDTYAGQIGPVNTTGWMGITIVAHDNAGNSTEATPLLVEVTACVN